jgi:hypothetical protein
MSKLKSLASEGKGNVAVILPDTATSARYTEFDAPYLSRALKAAGLTPYTTPPPRPATPNSTLPIGAER